MEEAVATKIERTTYLGFRDSVFNAAYQVLKDAYCAYASTRRPTRVSGEDFLAIVTDAYADALVNGEWEEEEGAPLLRDEFYQLLLEGARMALEADRA